MNKGSNNHRLMQKPALKQGRFKQLNDQSAVSLIIVQIERIALAYARACALLGSVFFSRKNQTIPARADKTPEMIVRVCGVM